MNVFVLAVSPFFIAHNESSVGDAAPFRGGSDQRYVTRWAWDISWIQRYFRYDTLGHGALVKGGDGCSSHPILHPPPRALCRNVLRF